MNIVGDHLELWDECPAQVEFMYNSLVNRTLKMVPFVVVFDRMPRSPVDLINWSHDSEGVEKFMNKLKTIQDKVKNNIN